MSNCDRTGVFPGGAWVAAASCGPNGGNCVEVNRGARGLVGLRDGTVVAGPVIVVDDGEWGAFLRAAKAGRLDRTISYADPLVGPRWRAETGVQHCDFPAQATR